MKTAFVVHVGENKDALEAKLRSIGEMGFMGVELVLVSPEETDIDRLRLLCDAAHLEIAAISTDGAVICDGLSLTSPEEEVRQAAQERLLSFVELGAKLKCPVTVGALLGTGLTDEWVRTVADGEKHEEAEAWCIAGLEKAAAKLSKNGCPRLLLQPLNRYETQVVNTVDDGLALLEKLNNPRVKLLLDTFHMNIEEANIALAISRAGRHIGLIHLIDNNRHALGSGHMDFKTIIRALRRAGYDGFAVGSDISEYSLAQSAEETLKAMVSLELWISQSQRKQKFNDKRGDGR